MGECDDGFRVSRGAQEVTPRQEKPRPLVNPGGDAAVCLSRAGGDHELAL